MSKPTVKDPMKWRAYSWENDVIEHRTEILEDHEADDAIMMSWKLYGFSERSCPTVDHSWASIDALAVEDERIRIPNYDKMLSYALHEVAHCIAYRKSKGDDIVHSPEWMGIYCTLLIAFGVCDRQTIMRSTKNYGVDINWKHKIPNNSRTKSTKKRIREFTKKIQTTRVRFSKIGMTSRTRETQIVTIASRTKKNG